MGGKREIMLGGKKDGKRKIKMEDRVHYNRHSFAYFQPF